MDRMLHIPVSCLSKEIMSDIIDLLLKENANLKSVSTKSVRLEFYAVILVF